jgi:hypothetical protein
MTPAEIESFVRRMSEGLGIELDGGDVPAVVSVFAVLERNAAVLMTFDLPEPMTAAPTFRIPAASDE